MLIAQKGKRICESLIICSASALDCYSQSVSLEHSCYLNKTCRKLCINVKDDNDGASNKHNGEKYR